MSLFPKLEPPPLPPRPLMWQWPATMATGTEAEVCADIARRQAAGTAKYGTTVAENPLELREWLQHQYEELLDAAIYTKRAIAEIDAGRLTPSAGHDHHAPAPADRQCPDSGR